MSRVNRGKRRGKPRFEERESRSDDRDDVLLDVRDLLLHILLAACCPTCSGTGRAHVDTKPDGSIVFGACECRRQGFALLGEFGLGPEGEGSEGDDG